MTRPLRRAHLRVWLGLAAALVVLFIASLAAKRPGL